MRKVVLCIFTGILLISCNKNTRNKDIVNFILEWKDKEIVFPKKVCYMLKGDTLNFELSKDKYKIISYIDSVGCVSCKLNIGGWKKLIQYSDSILKDSLQYLLIFSPENISYISYILEKEGFSYPVCFDLNDSLKILNNFPIEMQYQTFLLNKTNKVVAIGNPVIVPQIKELYSKIILGNKKSDMWKKKAQTTAVFSETYIDLGDFSWDQEQKKEIQVFNTGDIPLVINDIVTSCGCITLDYSKEPLQPRKSFMLKISYKAEHSGHFDKTIAVHCNVKETPILLNISGNSK